jgi:putative transposase
MRHGEAQRDTIEYIVSFYNGVRLHSNVGYLSPAAYERQTAATPPILVSETT